MCPCTLEKDFLIDLPTTLRSVVIYIIRHMSVKICLHGYGTAALTTQFTETLIAAGDVLLWSHLRQSRPLLRWDSGVS